MRDRELLGPDAASLARARAAIAEARQVAVLTGAGMSAESGIPTFRDALTGLWARFDPPELASVEGFRADPQRVWDWYAERREGVRRAEPNAGHHALAAWARALTRARMCAGDAERRRPAPARRQRRRRPPARRHPGRPLAASACPRAHAAAARPMRAARAAAALRARAATCCARAWCGSAKRCRRRRSAAAQQRRRGLRA